MDIGLWPPHAAALGEGGEWTEGMQASTWQVSLSDNGYSDAAQCTGTESPAGWDPPSFDTVCACPSAAAARTVMPKACESLGCSAHRPANAVCVDFAISSQRFGKLTALAQRSNMDAHTKASGLAGVAAAKGSMRLLSWLCRLFATQADES